MNIVKIVNQYLLLGTNNSATILESENGQYFWLQTNIKGSSYELVTEGNVISWISQHFAEVSTKDTTEGPYLKAYKLYLQDNFLHDDSYQTAEHEAKEFLMLALSLKQIKRLIERSA